LNTTELFSRKYQSYKLIIKSRFTIDKEIELQNLMAFNLCLPNRSGECAREHMAN